MSGSGTIAIAILLTSSAALAGDARKDLEGLERKLHEVKEEARDRGAEASGILGEVEALDRRIDGIEEEAGRLVEAIRVERAKEERARSSVERLEREFEAIRSRFLARARGLYRLARRGWGPIVLQAPGDFGEFLRYSRYLQAILERDRSLAARVRSNRELSQAAHAEARAAARELERLEEASARELHAVRKERGEKVRLLGRLREEGERRSRMLEELQASATKLRGLIEAEVLARAIARKKPPSRLLPPLESGAESAEPARNGVEIVAPEGTAVHAVAGGRVVYAGWLPGYGKLIILDHGGHLHSIYGYAGELLARKGDVVAAGRAIARVGSTGVTEGNRLYFEIRLRGDPQDPGGYIPVLR